MKTIKVFLILLFCCVSTAGLLAQTTAQRNFQNSILSFLRDDMRLSPFINNNGSIEFKDSNDETHWVNIVSEQAPFFVMLTRAGYTLTGDRGLKRAESILAANAVNAALKAVKLYCSDTSVSFRIEQYFQTDNDFKYVFSRNLTILEQAEERFLEEYNKLVR